jgi:hypothetical protein
VNAVLEAAARAVAEAESSLVGSPAPTLSAEYLDLVRAVEALPENQDGADKTGIGQRWATYRRHFAGARRLP